MRVRALIEREHNGQRLLSGEVGDVPDAVARGWISAGQAEPVGETRVNREVAGQPVETAALDRRQQRPRRRTP